MSAEIAFVQQIIQSGSSVVIDARKWSIDSVQQLATAAKVSGSTITVRHATGWALANKNKVQSLAVLAKKSLILDFTE